MLDFQFNHKKRRKKNKYDPLFLELRQKKEERSQLVLYEFF